MDEIKEITNLIERLDVFEERLSVRLGALSARIEADFNRGYIVRLNGELHSQNGTTLKQLTRVIVDLYDVSGRILGTNQQYSGLFDSMDPESFFGFETFSINVEIPIAAVGKLRVYPIQYEGI